MMHASLLTEVHLGRGSYLRSSRPEGLRELRTQVFLPWMQRLWNTPDVVHDNLTDQRFHASLILGFADPETLRAFFESGEIALLSGKLRTVASAVHAYEVTETLTYVKHGKVLPRPQ